MTLATDALVNESKFLSRIKKALGKTETVRTKPYPSSDKTKNPSGKLLGQKHRNRSLQETSALIEELKNAATPLGIHVIECDTIENATVSITDLALSKPPEWSPKASMVAWAHPLIDALNLDNALKNTKITCHREWCEKESTPPQSWRQEMRLQASNALMGITSADFCVAGTATLVITARKGQSRSASLLPSIHVAVIKASQLIKDIKELHAILQWDEDPALQGPDRSMTLISGPSKTADIEATMIHGAHGPRELYIYVIN